MIFRNMYTGEWGFPAAPMKWGTTFTRAKQDLFLQVSGDKFKVRFVGTLPHMHTLRHFTEAEKEDPINAGLKGVRTYFYLAHHYRGLPYMADDIAETHHYDDFAWIPKRQMNEYMSKEYYDVFIGMMQTR